MLECGFQKKECNDKCAMYIKGTKECAIVSIAALLEGLHNMGVLAHDKYIKEDPYADFEDEDPLAKALIDGDDDDDDDDFEEDEEAKAAIDGKAKKEESKG